jgi:Protein of unknown function (DUF4239)
MNVEMWLTGFSTATLGVGVVVIGIVLSLAGLQLVRRIVPHTLLKQHNDVLGFVYSMVGVVYAVLLAFTIVVSWEQYEGATRNVEEEASAVGDLYRDARAFGATETVASVIQTTLVRYVQAVVWEEWKTMAKGQESGWAKTQYELIWRSYYEYQPVTPQQISFYGESLRRLNELGDHRRARLLSSRNALPPILWTLLITGCGLTVALTYFFGVETGWIHGLVVASLSGLICFCLFLLLSLDYPFAGGTAIQPQAFQDFIVDK